MKIVVIGGTGLIGTKVVQKLGEAGHEAIAASPRTGVDTVTGKGLAEALTGADVLVDLSNLPSFEDQAAMDFFRTAGTNIEATAAKAGSTEERRGGKVCVSTCRSRWWPYH